MAPGWIHGCLGLNYAFGRQGRGSGGSAGAICHSAATAGVLGTGLHRHGPRACGRAALGRGRRNISSPANAEQRLAIQQWKDNLLNWYFSIIFAAFMAREIRNLVERRRKGLVEATLSGTDREHSARLVGAGGKPQLSSAARRDVRRPGALLDLPRAGDRGPGELSAAREGRAGPRWRGSTRRPEVRLACQLRPQGNVPR